MKNAFFALGPLKSSAYHALLPLHYIIIAPAYVTRDLFGMAQFANLAIIHVRNATQILLILALNVKIVCI